MKTAKKLLSLIVCMALIACMALTGMPMVSAEDTETETTTTYPLDFALLNGTEWPIVGPGLNGVISGNADYDVMNFDRYFNFTADSAAGIYTHATVNRADTNVSYYKNGVSDVDFSGADVFTFVLTVEDNGAWDVYKDYFQVILKDDAVEYPIPAADIADALKDYVPGTTQKIKFNLSNMDKTALTAINNIKVGVEAGAAESELNLHVKISAMKAEVLPASVLFANLSWDWPVVNPGLTGTISGDASRDAATLNRYLNFTSDISTDVKNFVSVVRTSRSDWTTVDLSLCDYFALNFWVEDNGAWDVYKDYITLGINDQTVPADATAKALANVVPGTWSRIYIDLNSINKSALTASNTFTISVAGTDQTSDLNLHVSANKIYGEVAHDDVMILDDEAGDTAGRLSINSSLAKVGTKSYTGTTRADRLVVMSGFWGGANISDPADISVITNNGLSGYFRFWVYVDTQAKLDLLATTSNDISIGDSTHPDGVNTEASPGAWLYWWNWDDQVTDLGWNEVILPIASAQTSGTVDLTNIKSMKLRINGGDNDLAYYFDDFRISYDGTPSVAYDDVVIVDDEAQESLPSSGATYVTNAAKFGSTSMRMTPYDGGNLLINGFWGRSHMASKDISAVTNNGKAGALRFWAYIPDSASLTGIKSGLSFVQIGDSTSVDGNNGDGYWHTWSGWADQITKVGWNEIILPFKGGSAVDYTNIRSLFIRTPNHTSGFTVYIDNMIVSESIAPTVESFEDVVILDEENGEDGPYAYQSTTRVRVGSYSLETTTLDYHGWMTYKGFYGEEALELKDISTITNNGKMGALRLWMYIEDASFINTIHELDANGTKSYIKLGTAKSPDGSYFLWNNWASQITKSGWNEIILPFADAAIETGVAPDTTAIDTLYMKFAVGSPSTVVYLDNIKVSEDIAPSPVDGDVNGDGVLSILDLITVKKSLANAEETYTADDLALVRKHLVNKW